MNVADANTLAVDAVADGLEPLLDDLVLVGGCAVSFLATDPAAPSVRATVDVDFAIELDSRLELRRMEAHLERCGPAHDMSDDAPICRFRMRDRLVDALLADIRTAQARHAPQRTLL
ncbi:MAG: hypothetical protein EA398_14635 [Deltaproteobacteria bacterium]|nr:MAG: hypothetical protein EA398_14635 [Deltaproteobacteria bacterium]